MKVPGLHSYYENISFTMPPLWEVGAKRQPFRRFRGSGTGVVVLWCRAVCGKSHRQCSLSA